MELGRSTLTVTALGLGCVSMSGTDGRSDDGQAIAVIHRALDLR
jgi:aryl-alcohol dehydrogenase-like predicted oxidoreductase